MLAVDTLLVLRFSAMGDVAMTVPVLQQFLEQNPAIKLVVVSRAAFKPLFQKIPYHSFHTIEPRGKHQGLIGFFQLFTELKKYRIHGVADLHQSIRTKLLTYLFKCMGLKTHSIDKGRVEKKQMTQRKNKNLTPLKLNTERYADVLRAFGFALKLKYELTQNKRPLNPLISSITGAKNQVPWIGISPFSQHAQKIYPLQKMHQVAIHLAEQGYRIFIFGGGVYEKELAAHWDDTHLLITSVIEKLTLKDELDLISNLDLMISMDSVGMHLASLEGVPTISIWGATHPYTGFLGFGQQIANTILMHLPCQPCSVYGNKPCYRKDFACMNDLAEGRIIEKVESILNSIKN